MMTGDDRDLLVLRVWGSFLAAILLVASAGGAYDFFVTGLVVTGPAVALVGLAFAVPFLLIAGGAAYWFAASVVKGPVLWSTAAVASATILSFLLLPDGTWPMTIVTAALGALIFSTWGMKPFVRPSAVSQSSR